MNGERVPRTDSVSTDVLGDVCVLGAGRTGLVAADYLCDLVPERVGRVTLVGGAASYASDATRALEARGVQCALATEDIEGDYDLCVCSPGIPVDSPFMANARAHAREVIGEPELAYRESPENWIAITGTNGKTTTTRLTGHLLVSGGIDAECVGNIGVVCVGQVRDRREGSWFVAELSSFQLETCVRLHPRVACLLNITPDHLEWHGSLEAYARAKERVFSNLDADDLAVVCDVDDSCADIARRLEDRGIRVVHVSAETEPAGPHAAYVDADGMLCVRIDGERVRLVPLAELEIKGAHNTLNALVASACALFCGADAEGVRQGLRGFRPLEHRIEPCGAADGVAYVNDSKATNVDAVVQALSTFEAGTIVCLLGGHDKGTELDELARACAKACKAAVCFGEAGERIAQALEDEGSRSLEVIRAPHMAEALERAREVASAGDTVLLSPACSSFDEFTSYGERGRIFKELVAGIVSEAGASC